MIVKLNYDPASGVLTDANGLQLTCLLNLNHLGGEGSDENSVENVIKLKNAGYDIKDMTQLKEADLI